MTDARNSFSIASDAYASDRPLYPAALFDWIAASCRDHRTAWDCATGNGQAALALAAHFGRVEATDISPEQIAHARPAPQVTYSVTPAERTGFAESSFDLVTVAQALHWFDFDAYWDEVRRVAKPGAFFCAWGYSWFEADAELRTALIDPLMELMAPHWAPNNRLIWDGYPSAAIGFPFKRVAAPAFAIRTEWDIEGLVRFIRTWSAYKLASAEPAAAAAIAGIEEAAMARFAGRGAIPLEMPLSIAAGQIA
jgi:SAM-dependent methyltransferase